MACTIPTTADKNGRLSSGKKKHIKAKFFLIKDRVAMVLVLHAKSRIYDVEIIKIYQDNKSTQLLLKMVADEKWPLFSWGENNRVQFINRNTPIRVRAGTKKSRPAGFLQ